MDSIAFLLTLASDVVAAILVAVFGRTLIWLRRALRTTHLPRPELRVYLDAFLSKQRSPDWEPGLTSEAQIRDSRCRVGAIPSQLHSVSLDQALTHEDTKHRRVWTVPAFAEGLLYDAGVGPLSLLRFRGRKATAFVLLGGPASGKSSLVIQLAHWIATRACTDSAYPIPVYVNLTHFGPPFALNYGGLSQLVDTSVAHSCPRYLPGPASAPKPLFDQDALRAVSQPSSDTRILYVLDGIDEMPRHTELADQHARRLEALADYIARHPQHTFLLTCRHEDYVALRDYRHDFLMSVQAILPWTPRLLRRYLRRHSTGKRAAPSIASLVKDALDKDKWGPFTGSPFLIALLVRCSSTSLPSVDELWKTFIRMRLVGRCANEQEYADLISTLERFGMAMTVRPTEPFEFLPRHRDLATQGGIVVEANVSSNPEFSIKPLQHYFAARYMLREMRASKRVSFPLTHGALLSAAKILTAIGADDARFQDAAVGYLAEVVDFNERAARFSLFSRLLKPAHIRQFPAASNALLAAAEAVLGAGDNGAFLKLTDGLRHLPRVFAPNQAGVRSVVQGIIAHGSPISDRRLLQLAFCSPGLFVRYPFEFLRLLSKLFNQARLVPDLSRSMRAAAAVGLAPNWPMGVATLSLRIVAFAGTFLYLYGVYYCSLRSAHNLVVQTAWLAGVRWPAVAAAPSMPSDAQEHVVRLIMLLLTTWLPWTVLRRARRIGLVNSSALTRLGYLFLCATFFRYALLLPLLSLLVLPRIPSAFEAAVMVLLLCGPASFIIIAQFRAAPRMAHGRHPTTRPFQFGRSRDLPSPAALINRMRSVLEGGGDSMITRTGAWILTVRYQAQKLVRTPLSATRWIRAAVVLTLIVGVSVLAVYRLTTLALLLVGLASAWLAFDHVVLQHYRAATRHLRDLRSLLAKDMRHCPEATLEQILGVIGNRRAPMWVRRKYVQFLVSDIPWTRALLHALDALVVQGDVADEMTAYLEVARMRIRDRLDGSGAPALDVDMERSLYGDARGR